MFKSILKRFSLLCIALYILIGCSTPKGLERRTTRLKMDYAKKGIFIPKDTVRTTDTLETIEYRNDTVIITRAVVKTLEPIVEYKTKWQTRYETKYEYKTVKVENRAMVDSLRQALKLERTKTRRETKQQRSCGRWKWLLWGLIIGLTIGIFRKQIWEIFKSKLGL